VRQAARCRPLQLGHAGRLPQGAQGSPGTLSIPRRAGTTAPTWAMVWVAARSAGWIRRRRSISTVGSLPLAIQAWMVQRETPRALRGLRHRPQLRDFEAGVVLAHW
jgi:hypothetical protein